MLIPWNRVGLREPDSRQASGWPRPYTKESAALRVWHRAEPPASVRASLLLLLVASVPVPGCLTSHVIGNHPEWREITATPEQFGLRAEPITFQSIDGVTLHAWRIAAQTDRGIDVVFAHGQGGNKSDMLERAAFLAAAGYGVLTVDLRAHGQSEGGYMTPGYKEADDVLAALALLKTESPERRVVLFGYSYGAVAVLLAAARTSDAAAIIADSAFKAHAEMMRRIVDVVRDDPESSTMAKLGIGFVRWPGVLWLSTVEFYLRTGVRLNTPESNAIHVVPQIDSTPLLFLSGERDKIAPPSDARELLNAATTPTKELVILSNVGHTTYSERSKQAYEEAVLRFLEALVSSDRSSD